jgi:adenosylmethionine-8-amino-7-oxononanoate aminotransferase
VRGIGLLGCVEGIVSSEINEQKQLIIDRDFGMRIDEKCENKGLIVRPLINMCVLSPPLIIQRDEIDQMFDILEESLDEVAAEML